MFKKFFIILLSSSVLMSSCNLDSPTQSSMDESVIYTTPALAEGAVISVIRVLMENNSHRNRYLAHYGTNTDVEVTTGYRNFSDAQQMLSNYSARPENNRMNTADNSWARLYTGIERTNIAIRAIREYNDLASNPVMASYLGEFLTLRAVLYSELIKAWGDVPARFEPVTEETKDLPRTNKYVIYKQLLADLEEASQYLPWPGSGRATTSERISKSFAKGLRARIALYAAGYSQRNSDGAIIRGVDVDPDLDPSKMYQIAKDECVAIINEEAHQLLPFESIFKDYLMKDKIDAGLESIWEIPFAAGRGQVSYNFGVKHESADKYTTITGNGGRVGPNPVMLYKYDVEDVRRFVTIAPYKWDGGKQVISQLNALYFGKFRFDWAARSPISSNDDGINWIYMRYADIYLMAAEAINELDGPAMAAPYLQKVRKRAFPNNLTKASQYNGVSLTSLSPSEFLNAIIDERAFEFAGEMLRKADLIRWNKLGEKANAVKDELIAIHNKTGIYANLPEYVYFKQNPDGETLEIYGLNFGDTDPYGEANYGDTDQNRKKWELQSSGSSAPAAGQEYWNLIFRNNPDTRQYWPVWQVFINNSNGVLNNGGVSYE